MTKGVIWANGSDLPVVPFAARYGLWATVARQPLLGAYAKDPFGRAESVDIHAALRSHTIWAAHQMFLEKKIGSIEVGKYADVVVFDPATVAAGPIYMREDLPGDQMRLYADAIGVEHVVVNGQQIVEHGQHTGRLPGQVLRSGRDTATRPMPARAA